MGEEIKKPSFLVYYDNEIIVLRLPDEEAGKLFKSLFPYGKYEIKPNFDESPALAMAFDILSMAIDRDKENYIAKCKKNKENIEKRWGKTGNQSNTNYTDKDKDKIYYQQIADMYNETCVSFSRLTKLSDSRKKAIKARLKQYSIDDFQRLFTMAEESSFPKGQNNRDWSANFDWLIKDANMAKVLDGNYADKPHEGRLKGTMDNPGKEDHKNSGSYEKRSPEQKEAVEAEIYEMAHRILSEKAFDRYHDKIRELIHLCCPAELFTEEQIDYMIHEWGIELLSKENMLIAPDEDNFNFWDARLLEDENGY